MTTTSKLVKLKITTIKRIEKYGNFKESYDDVINKIIENLKFGDIKKSEIIQLLKARGRLQKELFEQAKQTRQEYFGNKVFVTSGKYPFLKTPCLVW